MKRESGILLHISSLPSKYGIGTFGIEAYKFVDFLNETNQTYWQLLPIGPTSYGDSPYQSFSINALNPYFIDLDKLVEEGLLLKNELKNDEYSEYVDYGNLYETRYLILDKAYNRFNLSRTDYQEFLNNNKDWVYDYAIFMALKNHFGGKSLLEWEDKYRLRDLDTLNEFKISNRKEINFELFMQFMAYKHFYELKAYAKEKGIKLIGDIPIYVAYDSSDVWTNPKLFKLDDSLKPTHVAGVPPDNFAKDGQLWGNPLYNWEEHQKEGFNWWVNRVKVQSKLFDLIRIDHFIGFVNYFSIEANEKTARNGKWEKALGFELFNTFRRELGSLDNIIAEDLGVITDEVRKLLNDNNLPGMKLLQFAFDSRDENDYIPHNYPINSIAYTGTHDNEPTKSWFDSLTKDDLAYAINYINSKDKEDRVDSLIKETLKSNSKIAIIPMQDYLNLGSEARMNTPSTIGNNWKWRLKENYLNKDLIKKIKDLVKLSGRANNLKK